MEEGVLVMKIVGTVKEVREQVKEWKKQGLSVGWYQQWDIFMKDIRALWKQQEKTMTRLL